jgi:hypothetical protein
MVLFQDLFQRRGDTQDVGPSIGGTFDFEYIRSEKEAGTTEARHKKRRTRFKRPPLFLFRGAAQSLR